MKYTLNTYELVEQIMIAIFGGLVGAIISYWSLGNSGGKQTIMLIIIYALMFLGIIILFRIIRLSIKKLTKKHL